MLPMLLMLWLLLLLLNETWTVMLELLPPIPLTFTEDAPAKPPAPLPAGVGSWLPAVTPMLSRIDPARIPFAPVWLMIRVAVRSPEKPRPALIRFPPTVTAPTDW